MKNENPLVSVVIPCYNHERFIQDCIQSVIEQTYENIELIIIDDGSNDNSVIKIQEMVESCKQRFTRFEFRSRSNIGLSATLNETLEWCNGEYYSAIASDDQMLKDKTTIQVRFLEENKEFLAAFGGVQLIDENNKVLGSLLRENMSYSFKNIIMHKHDLPAPTQMIRMSAIKGVGGYNTDLLIEDWYILLKLSLEGDIYYMKEILCLYRKHNNNISKDLLKIHQGRLDVLNCFKDYKVYKNAVKNTKWVNLLEMYVSEKRSIYILKLFIINPKKTAATIIKRLKNEERII